jgi:hypothetical protein
MNGEMLDQKKRFILLGIIFVVVLALGLFFSEALAEFILQPLLLRLWRDYIWLSNLPYLVWWLLLLVLFIYSGMHAFFFKRESTLLRAKPPAREMNASWVRRWISPVKQSTGGPFIRDAMMSYRRLAVSVLAQKENLTPRQVSRQLLDGERSLPEPAAGLLSYLEVLEERRASTRTRSVPALLERLRRWLEGRSPEDAHVSASAEEPSKPDLRGPVREQIVAMIEYLEEELEIRHDHDSR